jgi:hypothetical protein
VVRKLLGVIGAGALAVVALWAFILIAAPSMPTSVPADKTATASPLRDPKLRDVTEQPHTRAIAEIPPAPKVKPTTTAPAGPTAAPATNAAAAPAVPASPPIPAFAPMPAPVPPLQPMPALVQGPAGTVDPPAPVPPATVDNTPEPDAGQAAADPANDPVGAAPAAVPLERQGHSARCTHYRTYNAATQSYRGFDGVVHPCRP